VFGVDGPRRTLVHYRVPADGPPETKMAGRGSHPAAGLARILDKRIRPDDQSTRKATRPLR